MNEIASDLGAFTGGLVFSALSWHVGALITRAVTQNAQLSIFMGGLLALIYASTRDGSAAAWGAWLALLVMFVKH